MNENTHPLDRSPTPQQLAAWVDGELSRPDAVAIEAWLADHPEAVREVDSWQQIHRLFRDQQAPTLTPARWQAALDCLERRFPPLLQFPRERPWRLRLMVGLTLASAALLGAVVLARSLWPTSPPLREPIVLRTTSVDTDLEDDEPFPVSAMSEVNIIHMDAGDADRIVTGQPVMGPIEFVSGDDIHVIGVEADPDDGHLPRLERGIEMPIIVVAKVGHDER